MNDGAARLGSLSQPGPGVGDITVQVQGATGHHDAAVAHAHQLFAFIIIGERNGGFMLMGLVFGANLQFAEHQDPFGRQRQVGLIRKHQFAVDGQAVQGRRTDIQQHLLVTGNRHLVTGSWHLVVGPGGRIGPAQGLRVGGECCKNEK